LLALKISNNIKHNHKKYHHNKVIKSKIVHSNNKQHMRYKVKMIFFSIKDMMIMNHHKINSQILTKTNNYNKGKEKGKNKQKKKKVK